MKLTIFNYVLELFVISVDCHLKHAIKQLKMHPPIIFVVKTV